MSFSLLVFAPIDIGQTYFTAAARDNFINTYLQRGWFHNELGKSVDLDADFLLHHPSLRLDVGFRLGDDASLRLAPVEGVRGLKGAELLLYSTGLALLVCAYELDEGASAAAALRAYQVLSRGHFAAVFGRVVGRLPEFFGSLPPGDTRSLRSDTVQDRPHWFHGVFLHVADSPGRVLSREYLHGLTGTNNHQEHAFADDRTLANFGWETTAVSTTSPAEAVNVGHLVQVVGYIWELHYLLDSLASRKIQTISEERKRTTLGMVREFRLTAATLLDVCDLARITMTDRYLRMMERMHAEWHLPKLKQAIEAKEELLNLAYTQLTDEEAEARAGRFNLIVLFLTIVSLFGVIAQVMEFFHLDPDPPLVSKVSIVIGPVALTCIVLLWWLRTRPR